MIIWFNGDLFEASASTISPLDRGLTLGDGVFETLAVFNGRAAYLVQHLDRLMGGLSALGIPLTQPEVEDAVAHLLSIHARFHGVMRITITRGPGGRGLASEGSRPSFLITLSPWLSGNIYAPVRLATSSIRRNEYSPASRLKTLSYADNILAAREAAEAGAEDALLLNTQGRVACSTICNLFLVTGATLVTPPVSDGVLPGIIRARIMDKAQVSERSIAPAELRSADAVFLTNSVRLLRPVQGLDGAPLSQTGMDQVQSLFDLICDEVAGETGIDPRLVESSSKV